MWPVSSVSLRPAHISSTRWTSNISVIHLCWAGPTPCARRREASLRNALREASGDPAMNGRSGRFFGPTGTIPAPRLRFRDGHAIFSGYAYNKAALGSGPLVQDRWPPGLRAAAQGRHRQAWRAPRGEPWRQGDKGAASAAPQASAADAEALDERAITGFVAGLDVVEQRTALRNQLQEATTRVVVLPCVLKCSVRLAMRSVRIAT